MLRDDRKARQEELEVHRVECVNQLSLAWVAGGHKCRTSFLLFWPCCFLLFPFGTSTFVSGFRRGGRYERGILDQRPYHRVSAGVPDIRPAEAGEVLSLSRSLHLGKSDLEELV